MKIIKRLLAFTLRLLARGPRAALVDPDVHFWTYASTEDGAAWVHAGSPRTKDGHPDMTAVAREQIVQWYLAEYPEFPSEYLRWKGRGSWLATMKPHAANRGVADYLAKDFPEWLSEPRPPLKVCR